MAGYKVGEVDWDDVEVGGGKGMGQFLSLKEVGEHRVRVFSKPYQYQSVWLPDSTGKDVKITCAFKANCEVCRPRMQARGIKHPSTRWYCLVIDRSDVDNEHPTGKVKILDMGRQICEGIKKLSQDEEWGSPKGYDVKINRGPKGANPLYTIVPAGQKSGFTDQEKTMCKAALNSEAEEYINLSAMCEPTSCEETRALLTGEQVKQAVADDAEAFGFGDNVGDDFDDDLKSPAEGTPAPKAESTEVEDEDDDFLDLS